MSNRQLLNTNVSNLTVREELNTLLRYIILSRFFTCLYRSRFRSCFLSGRSFNGRPSNRRIFNSSCSGGRFELLYDIINSVDVSGGPTSFCYGT